MYSKYYSEEQNGTVQSLYENDMYDLTISATHGQVSQVKMDAKTEDSNKLVHQLLFDLTDTTVKMEQLVNFMRKCGKFDEETLNEMNSMIYHGHSESAKKRN